MKGKPVAYFAAGMVAGGVIVSSLAFAASSYAPESRAPEVFLSGNEWLARNAWYQYGYVSGIVDLSQVLALEGIAKSLVGYLIVDVARSTGSAMGDADSGEQRYDFDLQAVYSYLILQENTFGSAREWAAFHAAMGWATYSAIQAFRLPKNVTDQQLADVVTKYVREHPEERHLSAAYLAWKAAAEAFGR